MFNFESNKRLIVLVIGLACLACTPNRYRLEGQGGDQWFLIEFIGVHAEEQLLGYQPLLVVDSVIYRSNQELKKQKLTFRKSDIQHIRVMSKSDALVRYGEAGKDGALLITLY